MTKSSLVRRGDKRHSREPECQEQRSKETGLGMCFEGGRRGAWLEDEWLDLRRDQRSQILGPLKEFVSYAESNGKPSELQATCN